MVFGTMETMLCFMLKAPMDIICTGHLEMEIKGKTAEPTAPHTPKIFMTTTPTTSLILIMELKERESKIVI